MVAEIDRLIRQHRNRSVNSATFLSAITLTISVNGFQNPGGTYTGGITDC